MNSAELVFGELTEKEFEGLDFACGSFLQSAEMYRRYKALGREAYLVGVRKGAQEPRGSRGAQGSRGASSQGEIVAAGLILVRPWRLGKKIMRVPGGWLMDYDGGDHEEILRFLTVQAREFCRKKGGMVIEISPNIVSQPRDNENKVVDDVDGDLAMKKDHLGVRRELTGMGYKYLGEYEQAKWTYVLELDGKTPEGLLMEFRTTHRQLIRKAEREGVRVRELGEDELGVLKQITAESGERHGFQEPEVEYYRSMKAAFGEKVKFVVAEIPAGRVREGDLGGVEAVDGYVPLAASMFIDDGRELVYLYSGSIRRLQRYNGAYAIQWWAIRRALEEGYARYNMYGVRPVAGNGVYAFKQGFRGRVEELLGTFALPVGLLGRLYLVRLKPREYGEIR